MKKTAVLSIILISVMALTSCTSAFPNDRTAAARQTILEMEMDENYDDREPFVNTKLFCVSQDLEQLSAAGSLEMTGGQGCLEVKDNKTNEVLWSDTFEGTVKSEAVSISLDNLKKDKEYAVSFTGTSIKQVSLEIRFDSDFVQERERPISS